MNHVGCVLVPMKWVSFIYLFTYFIFGNFTNGKCSLAFPERFLCSQKPWTTSDLCILTLKATFTMQQTA